jgi:hypothetical protein
MRSADRSASFDSRLADVSRRSPTRIRKDAHTVGPTLRMTVRCPAVPQLTLEGLLGRDKVVIRSRPLNIITDRSNLSGAFLVITTICQDKALSAQRLSLNDSSAQHDLGHTKSFGLHLEKLWRSTGRSTGRPSL